MGDRTIPTCNASRPSRLALSAVGLIGLVTAGCTHSSPPDSLVGDYLSGNLAARLNAIDDAARSFEEAFSEAPQSNEILREAFFFHLASGEIDEARYYAQTLVDREPFGGGDDGLARIVLASYALKYGDSRKARDLLREEFKGPYFEPLRTILDAWAVKGVDGAEAAIDRLMAVGETQFKGFNPLHAALIAESEGLNDEARAAHQLSIMTYGGPIGREAFGAFLERVGDVENAREYYGLLAKEAGPSKRLASAGLSRIDAGNPSMVYQDTHPGDGAAIALFSYGAALFEETINRQNARGRGGNYNGASYNLPLVLGQLAIDLDPNLDIARRFVGSIFNVYGDYQKAINVLAKARSSSYYYEQIQIEMARSYAALERTDDAINHLQALVADDPAALDGRWALANFYGNEKQYEKAIGLLDELINSVSEQDQKSAWRYYVSRGEAYLNLDDWTKAEADLKRAVELAPDEPTALNYLGYMWAERGENLEEAFELIEKAVSLQPDSGAIVDSLGWAHYQLGDYEEALGHLEMAASMISDDPTITDHLGDVYWRLGRKIEARYQWKHALELDPPDDLKSSVEEKLKSGLKPE